jgi:hypothetical protein
MLIRVNPKNPRPSAGYWAYRWPQFFLVLQILLLAAVWPAVIGAGDASREEALAMAYPGAVIRAETIFLTDQERKEAAAKARVEIPSALIARYVATRERKVVGRAYVDTHQVRTKKESLLILLDESGVVKRIEVTAFLEPPEYHASPAWYAQYEGKTLSEDLNLQRSIRPVAGATLTAAAANQAVRRVLAIDQVLQQRRAVGEIP